MLAPGMALQLNWRLYNYSVLSEKTSEAGDSAGTCRQCCLIGDQIGHPAQGVELELRWQFCVHSSTCPEMYFQSKF